jgi:hypothetical protein
MGSSECLLFTSHVVYYLTLITESEFIIDGQIRLVNLVRLVWLVLLQTDNFRLIKDQGKSPGLPFSF